MVLYIKNRKFLVVWMDETTKVYEPKDYHSLYVNHEQMHIVIRTIDGDDVTIPFATMRKLVVKKEGEDDQNVQGSDENPK